MAQYEPVIEGASDDPLAAIEAASVAAAVPAGFARRLFAGVAREDLADLPAAALGRIAAATYAHLARRPPGRPAVRVADPAGAALADRTVIEIVNDDMPFLLDSVMGEIAAATSDVRLVAHPILHVRRTAEGELLDLDAEGAPDAVRESLIHIEIGRVEPAAAGRLVAALEDGLGEVRRAVEDWKPMLAALDAAIDSLRGLPETTIAAERVRESIALLEWLAADNFVFLGMRSYDFDGTAMRRAATGALGILSVEETRVLSRGDRYVTTTPEIRAFLLEPDPLVITKSNIVSRIHRRVPMDYVGVKRYDAAGRLVGELRIVGLLASTAYTRSARTIPLVARKIDRIVARSGFAPSSHSGKALVDVLESWPRDELFQIDEETLFEQASLVRELGERPRIRVLARRDRFDRFVSILVFLPRERYDAALGDKIATHLAAAYAGTVGSLRTSEPEGSLTRLHVVVERSGPPAPEPSRARLEELVGALSLGWIDGLTEALSRRHPAAEARRLAARYSRAFSAAYRDRHGPETAADDVAVLESLGPARPVAVDFTQSPGRDDAAILLRLMHFGGPLTLSLRVPLLENFGFRVIDENSYEVATVEGGAPVVVHDMTLEPALGRAGGGDTDRLLEEAFRAVVAGETESDGLDGLVVAAGLDWRAVALLRTLVRYLRQIGIAYAPDYIAATLVRHAGIARRLVECVTARFAPGAADPAAADAARAAIIAALDQVASLDEDTILRRVLSVVDGIVRTNFFRRDAAGAAPPVIAFKLDPRRIEGVPAPRPHREIFLSGPRVEGLHLRFGPVARGGIRWSDRPQDFRTEILGLVKAQQVKNAVIVPVGAKGGFVPKKLPATDRDAIAAEGKAAYKLFIATLLDLTDDIEGDAIVPPDAVERADGDDPYLVVAADKGTATFSDTANALAEARGFWLGDAFASGGSAGYDHKAMGITARGAWEAVKRHFRELDVDIGTAPFTAVGVGDMSGDVFGNGLLRERTTRLVAAFDHRDIFIDPDPDPAASFAERRRLFALPRSSWQDYDRALISKGGGVFSRREKAIVLSPEARAALGIAEERLAPAALIRAILKAKVDLLFFGGIGTYVRAADETDAQVGDKANDALRITGAEIGARVVGEGANLGMTQKGRIEYALAGGRVNSDAIDNSAGVNTSDLEVNVKIALAAAERAGRLDRPARNALLAAMTESVAALVLANNYRQTLALSLAERRGPAELRFETALMADLEARGLLDRAVESLADDARLAARAAAGRGLTRPELGVLLAFAKIALFSDLVASGLPDEPALAPMLAGYFPAEMRERFADEIAGHRLRREIVSTVLANEIVNRGGPTLVTRVAERTGTAPAEIARGFLIVRGALGLDALDDALDGLDGRIPGTLQVTLYARVQDVLTDALGRLLRQGGLAAAAGLDAGALAGARDALAGEAPLDPEAAADAEALAAAGLPPALARRFALLPRLAALPEIETIARQGDVPVAEAARVHAALAERFALDRLARAAHRLGPRDPDEAAAIDRALETLSRVHRRLALEVIRAGAGGSEDDPLGVWWAARAERAARIAKRLDGILAEAPTVARIVVAAGLVSDLLEG
ncbi:NAD-glutamate dehydrogenase [Prosthecomicrobium pneumaticum]|uniref:Glutamate dehydrogenase n=1 Tax=Prosthecomicrobium pneumaticum TaxID=81895 RepID=A0A7W9L2J6_9HYPH|nr:NAD-glutamate dehydrogenase [Prosthecomicrobium pneumaticum]MBB5753561.1 glutamate dehydrogenase [Prosthecomicrobium pneumaticum]